MFGKKTLWVAHEAAISGASLCLIEYLEVLQKFGVKTYLIVPKLGALSKQAEAIGVTVFMVPFYSWTQSLYHPEKRSIISLIKKWARNKYAIAQIKKFIEEVNADYVITNTVTFSVAAHAAKKANIPHLWFVHEFGDEDHGFIIEGGMKRGRQKMADLSEKIVVNSKVMANKFKPYVSYDKLFIIKYIIPVYSIPKENFSGSTYKFLMLGQIAPSKNQADAIEAIIWFKNKGYDCQLNIVGHVVNQEYKKTTR